MCDQDKSKEQLIEELRALREEVVRLETKIRQAEGFEGEPAQNSPVSLLEERSRMNAILASLNIGLCLINRDMTLAWANATIARMSPAQNPAGGAAVKSPGQD